MEKKTNKWIWRIPFLILLIVGTILVIRKQNTTSFQKDEGFVFGTIYHITYQSDRNLKSEIEAELAKVDHALSPFNPKSIITAINENRDTEVDRMFSDVFQTAMEVSRITGGAFDITVSPLVNTWGFGFKHDTTPDSMLIDSIRQFVDYRKVKLAGKKVIKADPRILLDCSSIAKGYGVDAVGRLLEKKGIQNYMVEIGGEVVTRGLSPTHNEWRIGINKPIEDTLGVRQELQEVIHLKNEAMATSGNYRNFYYKNGKRYAHTIDPATGYPVEHDLLSATVIASTCTLADAYATAFMVMGREKALQLLEKLPGLSVYFIYRDADGNNAVYYSPNLRKRMTSTQQSQP